MNSSSFLKYGWICPVCERVYSPFTSMCSYCGGDNRRNITTTTGTGGYTVPSQTARDTEVKK